MFRRFLILIIVFISFYGTSALAQVQNSDITLSISPDNPKANEKIEANISSYVINVKDVYFVWKVNDEVKSAGIGRNTFSFTLGNTNSQTLLSVEIETLDGKFLNKSISISGSDIDMLWEAVDSYSPPFYKGKTLVGREGEIKIVAIPSVYSQNKKISPNTLSYQWEHNGNAQQTASGFGKSSFFYKNNFLNNSDQVEVTISDINNQNKTTNKITVVPREPKILFYKKDASGIRIDKIIQNNHFVDKEGENIVVAPYFFSPRSINPDNLEIRWFVNGAPTQNPSHWNELSIKPGEETSGTANIRVIISNLGTLFQGLEKSINVNF